MKNYYDVKDRNQEKSTYTFDKDIAQVLKDNKFIINIKKKNFGFNKYLLDETIDLKHFALVNEVFQSYRFKEYSFDVKFKIRQATSQKEKLFENVRDFKIEKMYQPFDEWAAKELKKEK